MNHFVLRGRVAVFAVAMLAMMETFASSPGVEAQAAAKPAAHPIPAIVEKDGRFALLVDGKPYLMLGVQANNSSAWPAYLDKVWPAAETLHANTVELPIYWEQFEPTQGKFDFSVVDLILKQAREHHVHLVLLWFGTWKTAARITRRNGSSSTSRNTPLSSARTARRLTRPRLLRRQGLRPTRRPSAR